MAASQYILKNNELTETLIKHFDIHEGQWFLIGVFGTGPGYFGPNSNELAPGITFIVNGIGLQRHSSLTPGPEGILVDAEKINPLSKTKA
jgi:hypothetical protein